MKGIGRATAVANNVTKQHILRALGEAYPPILCMTTPPNMTPMTGPVMQVIEKKMKTYCASIPRTICM